MLCDKCLNNAAILVLTQTINGIKYTYNLCEKCSKEIDGLNISYIDKKVMSIAFHDFLGDVTEYIYKPIQEDKKGELLCTNCNMPYSEFKSTGILGCSECYENFNSVIVPVIKRVQGSIAHVGKIPEKLVRESETLNLDELQKMLKMAIETEEYERAAELRDIIRGIQKDVK